MHAKNHVISPTPLPKTAPHIQKQNPARPSPATVVVPESRYLAIYLASLHLVPIHAHAYTRSSSALRLHLEYTLAYIWCDTDLFPAQLRSAQLTHTRTLV